MGRERERERESERGKGATSSLVANDIGDPCCALASLDVCNLKNVSVIWFRIPSIVLERPTGQLPEKGLRGKGESLKGKWNPFSSLFLFSSFLQYIFSKFSYSDFRANVSWDLTNSKSTFRRHIGTTGEPFLTSQTKTILFIFFNVDFRGDRTYSEEKLRVPSYCDRVLWVRPNPLCVGVCIFTRVCLCVCVCMLNC